MSESPKVLLNKNRGWDIRIFVGNFLHAVPTQELHDDLTNFSFVNFLVHRRVWDDIPFFLASIKSRVRPLFCALSSPR